MLSVFNFIITSSMVREMCNDYTVKLTFTSVLYTVAIPLRKYYTEINTPVLFYTVHCNSSHSGLLQCVDLQHIGIGIHNCDEVAAIVCVNSTDDITTSSFIATPTPHTCDINISKTVTEVKHVPFLS